MESVTVCQIKTNKSLFPNQTVKNLNFLYLKQANIGNVDLSNVKNTEQVKNFEKAYYDSNTKISLNFNLKKHKDFYKLSKKSNLKNAQLPGVDLKEATLTDANLTDADLTNTKGLTLAQVKKAKNWDKAIYNGDLKKQVETLKEQQ